MVNVYGKIVLILFSGILNAKKGLGPFLILRKLATIFNYLEFGGIDRLFTFP